MAGGTQSPRQKMINLMYLVFIAMLAMNMSKEVLSAFGFMNEKLVENNSTATEKNNQTLSNLTTKAQEQPDKYGNLSKIANNVNQLSKDFSAFLEAKKVLFLTDQEDPENYEAMDQANIVDEHFFVNDKEHQLAVIKIIRKYQPDIILCNALEDRHPDHGRSAKLVSDAAFLSGLRKIVTNDEGKMQDAWKPKYVFHYIISRLDPQNLAHCLQ